MARHAGELGKQMHGNPYMTKDMARIVLKLILLRRIQKSEVYSYALIKEFDNPRISGLLKKKSGVKNDIYNVVKVLEQTGYIKSTARMDAGRLKKYYSITPKGKIALKESKRLFMESMKGLMMILR